MQSIPNGTVTFLFTDIEGSTHMWEKDPDAMRVALARHDELMRQAIEENDGYVFKTIGDAFCASFHTAKSALSAAQAAQLALQSEVWPERISMKVRMALHTGVGEIRDGDYFGSPLNRVARLLSVGHGGQVLLSRVTQGLLQDDPAGNWSFQSLGDHRLRDLNRPETVFQLRHPELPDGFPPLKSLDNPGLPNNLPIQLTTFIGREREIAEVGALLERVDLITLTGSGGSGKTRLSMQVAANALESFPDGVWQAEFAPISDYNLVAPTLAKILHIAEIAGSSTVNRIVHALNTKHMLLVFDNCEHVLQGCAELAAAILRGCPKVKILATSRAPLGIWGEQCYRVPSLSMPDLKSAPSVESAREYESVRLLVDRATLVKPEFALTEQNASALVQICARLDGIPLAIELAAARIRSMSTDDINSRLDNRFRLLTGGDRNALPRQQTLRALIDWSYELLSEPEKRLLARLSVFAGGWRLEESESVCSGAGIEEWEVLDLLDGLNEKSLVFSEESAGVVRHHLLETVRQYAAERLRDFGDEDRVRTRHLNAYLAIAEEAAAMLRGSEQQEWLDRLDRDHDNLRTALAWSTEGDVEEDLGLRLAGSLHRFWSTRGHLSEGREHLSRALLSPCGTAARGAALIGLGRLAWFQGDYDVAESSFLEALRLGEQLGDKRTAAYALLNLGNVACNLAKFDEARGFNSQCLTIYRELDDKFGIANALGNLGNVASDSGDYAAARPLYEENLSLQIELDNKIGIAAAYHNLGLVTMYQEEFSAAQAMFDEGLRLFRSLQHKSGMASMLGNLGIVTLRSGDVQTARQLFEECLGIRVELGDKKGLVHGLEEMAMVFGALSEPWRATRLWSAGAALRASLGIGYSSAESENNAQQIELLRGVLGPDPFQVAWEQGRLLSWEDAVTEALSRDPAQT